MSRTQPRRALRVHPCAAGRRGGGRARQPDVRRAYRLPCRVPDARLRVARSPANCARGLCGQSPRGVAAHIGGAPDLRARWRWHHRASQLGSWGRTLFSAGARTSTIGRPAAPHRCTAVSCQWQRCVPDDDDLAMLLQEPPMTEEELEVAEAAIAQHLSHFLEVGRLLVRIQGSRVYRYLGYRPSSATWPSASAWAAARGTSTSARPRSPRSCATMLWRHLNLKLCNRVHTSLTTSLSALGLPS